jgi:hypothetical protein
MLTLEHLHKLSSSSLSLDTYFQEHISCFKNHHIYTYIIYEILSSDILPDLKDTLQNDLYEARSKHIIYTQAFYSVISILESAGCEYILLKGPSLWDVYPDEYIRDQEDIDILIRQEDQEHVIEQLSKEGFTPHTDISHSFHIPLSHNAPDKPDIEIHTAVSPPGKNRIDTEILFAHKTAKTSGKQIFSALDPEYTLLYSLIHCANHHIVSRLKWLNDIRLLVGSGLDCSFLKDLKGSLKRSAFAGLFYTDILFSSPSVSEALALIRAPRIFKSLCTAIIPYTEFLENPVTVSPLRKALYNIALIQNPINILRAFSAKK